MQVTTDAAETDEVEAEEDKKLVIFLETGSLEAVWSAFILSTTAVAMGMRATVFFTFWGLFPLVKNDVRITGENWMQRAVSFMNRGGTDHLKLSKLNMLGAGPAMMKKLARQHKVASPRELLETARDMGVSLIPCQMTMDLLGLKREDLIEGVGEPAGATSALLEADGATTLFI